MGRAARRLHPSAWLGLLAAALVAVSPAKSLSQEPIRAFRAARIVPSPGSSVEPGVLLVRGGRVEGVLPAGAELPSGAVPIDLGDLVILPGLVNPLSAIGEAGHASERTPGVVPTSAAQPADSRRRVARDSVRPEETFLRRIGETGYAALGWLPDTRGLLAGQAFAIRPRKGGEAKAEDLVLGESAFLLLSFELGKSWRETLERELKKAADAIAREAAEKRKAAEKKAAEKSGAPAEGKDPKPAPEEKPEEKEKGKEEKKDEKRGGPERLTPEGAEEPVPAPGAEGAPKPPSGAPAKPQPPDPLVMALRGELPLFVRLRSPAAIDHFFRIWDPLAFRPELVLILPPLPGEIVEKLASRRDRIRAVILEPRVAAVWETSVLSSAPRLFLQKGIEIALVPVSDSIPGHEGIFLPLAELARSGLAEREVLAAVTTTPARLLGLEGKVGVLEKGAFASFSAFEGDPLSGTARLRKVYVEGVEVFSEDPATGALSGEAVR